MTHSRRAEPRRHTFPKHSFNFFFASNTAQATRLPIRPRVRRRIRTPSRCAASRLRVRRSIDLIHRLEFTARRDVLWTRALEARRATVHAFALDHLPASRPILGTLSKRGTRAGGVRRGRIWWHRAPYDELPRPVCRSSRSRGDERRSNAGRALERRAHGECQRREPCHFSAAATSRVLRPQRRWHAERHGPCCSDPRESPITC